MNFLILHLGQWPQEGPKPSKFAVLFFYLSVIFTMIGVIIVIRSAFYVEVGLFLLFVKGSSISELFGFFRTVY